MLRTWTVLRIAVEGIGGLSHDIWLGVCWMTSCSWENVKPVKARIGNRVDLVLKALKILYVKEFDGGRKAMHDAAQQQRQSTYDSVLEQGYMYIDVVANGAF